MPDIVDYSSGGIALFLIGGYAMAGSAHLSLLHTRWLFWGQALFGLSALLWLFILLPLQTAQSRLAQRFATTGEIPEAYWKLSRRWLGWGVLATVPLMIIVYLMLLNICRCRRIQISRPREPSISVDSRYARE